MKENLPIGKTQEGERGHFYLGTLIDGEWTTLYKGDFTSLPDCWAALGVIQNIEGLTMLFTEYDLKENMDFIDPDRIIGWSDI